MRDRPAEKEKDSGGDWAQNGDAGERWAPPLGCASAGDDGCFCSLCVGDGLCFAVFLPGANRKGPPSNGDSLCTSMKKLLALPPPLLAEPGVTVGARLWVGVVAVPGEKERPLGRKGGAAGEDDTAGEAAMRGAGSL
jgi:hypothetical protein